MKYFKLLTLLAILGCAGDTGPVPDDYEEGYDNIPYQLIRDLEVIGRDGVKFIREDESDDLRADPATLPESYLQEVTIQTHFVWKDGMALNLEVKGERRVVIANLSTANLLSHDPMAGQSMYMVDGVATPHCYDKPDKNKVWLMCMYQNHRGEYMEMNYREGGYHTKYTQHELGE